MLRRLPLFLVLFSVFALTACQINPATGKSEFLIWSADEEQALGLSADQEIVQGQGLVSDPKLNNYVSDVGQRLVAVSHIPKQEFHFRVLDDSVVNAFALPGGYVYVTRGILAYLPDEGALAGVMGHEIGHVAGRHSNQRATRSALWKVGLSAASMMTEEFYGFGGVVSQAAGLFLLSYDRDQERQADELGVEYATNAHWDTEGMGRFFGTLGKLSGGGQRLPSWQSTHPDPGERNKTVLEMTREREGDQPERYKKNQARYYAEIEGLAFGPNPRQGFIDQGWFRHPELGVEFSVPAGWKTQNAATEFRMAPPGGGAIVSFAIGKQSTPTLCANALSSEQGASEITRRSLRIAGHEAVELVLRLTTEKGSLDLVSTFIGLRSKVVVFNGMTRSGGLDAHRRNFAAIAGSLRDIKDPGIIRVQPARLKIIQTSREASFRTQVAPWPVPALSGIDVDGLALVNGLEADDIVPSGTLLKVLVQR